MPSVLERLAEDLLPTELWTECWRHVNVKDIWNVRLVCKEFSKTGRIFLYRALHCWSPNQEDVEEKNWDMWCKHFLWSARRFVVLATGPFVYHVEEWSFSGIEQTRSFNDTNANIRGVGVLVDAYQTALNVFLNTLPLYPNLHTITLISIRVDKDVQYALSRMPKLKNLSLVETNTIIRPTSPLIPPLPLQKLRIVTSDGHNPEAFGDLTIASPSELKTLILHSYEFSEACLHPLVQASEPLGVLTHLSLNLRESTLELLRDIIKLCPALDVLDIHDFDYKDSREVRYPSPKSFSVIPHLRYYHGPAYLAARALAASPFVILSLHSGKSKENSYTYSEMHHLLRRLSNPVPLHMDFSVVNPDPRLFDILASIFSSVKSLYICFNDHASTEVDSFEYREVALKGIPPFKWQVRPSDTLMVCVNCS